MLSEKKYNNNKTELLSWTHKFSQETRKILKKIHQRTFFDFLLAGSINAVITYFTYLIFLQLMSYSWAYTINYPIGIVSAYLLNCLFVYKKKVRIQTVIAYPLLYVCNYIFGLLLLFFFTSIMGISPALSPLFIIVIIIPWNFILTSVIFR